MPVSRRWAAKEYLTPILLYIQSTIFPGALEKNQLHLGATDDRVLLISLTYIVSNIALPSRTLGMTNDHSEE